MTPLNDFLVRLPSVLLLAYVPFVCYADLKWREFRHRWWLPLWVVNLPLIFYLYRLDLYPITALPLSLIMCGIFWAMHHFDYIQGADTLWLWAISLFFVANPLGMFPHGPEQIPFFLYLMVMMILSAPVALLINWRNGKHGDPLQMMNTYGLGIHLMVPISAALVITMVMS